MKKNEGPIDRIIRISLAVILALFSFTMLTGILQLVIFIVAGVLLFTGISGFCLLYKIFGFNTCPVKK